MNVLAKNYFILCALCCLGGGIISHQDNKEHKGFKKTVGKKKSRLVAGTEVFI